MDGIATALESGDNILGRRLKESHNVGDKLVLALDVCKGFKLVFAYIESLFNISSLQAGEHVVFLTEALDELGGCIAGVGAHQGAGTMEGTFKFGKVVDTHALESLDEEFVLNNEELHVVLEALATQRGGLLGVEAAGFDYIVAAIFLDGLGDFRYNESFVFFFRL